MRTLGTCYFSIRDRSSILGVINTELIILKHSDIVEGQLPSFNTITITL